MKEKTAGKKVGFGTYLAVLNFGYAVKNFSENGEALITVLTFFMLIGCFTWVGGDAIPYSPVFALFFIIALTGLVFSVRQRPSLFHQMPMSPARRTAFFFLASLVNTLFVAVVTFLCLLIAMLVVALIVLAVTGEWIFVAESTPPEAAGAYPCMQGYLLGAVLTLVLMGAVLVIAPTRKKLVRNALTLAIPVFVTVPLLLLMRFSGIEKGMLFVLFDTIPYSPLYLAVFGVLGAALCAVGVWRVVELLRSKDY